MSARRSKSFKERLAAAKLPERSIQVCLRGDLSAEHDDLERQLKAARQVTGTGPARMGSKGAAVKIAEQLTALQKTMADEMLTVTVRALPRPEWMALIKAHPPRDDNDGDKAMGVHLEPFMGQAMPRCIVDPVMDADDWTAFEAVLSSGDFDRVLNAVWDVNRSGVDVPKSRLASLVMAESAAVSKSPEPTE